ncbi:long-chain fatty acid transport protein [Marinilabiliaceae bacterium JC017]|nr:long-chain fatty acid transport protein [Marinilabiliaceae bacterium JC017]
MNKRHFFFRLSSICYLLIANLISILGQDAHYWTEQYGTKSMLLSGSVVGSVSDLGAVYYNPARLGVIENPAFVISAKVHQLKKVTIEDALGDNIDLKKSEFGGVPSLVAGTFKIKWLPKHRFAYAFLTRHNSDLDFSTRQDVFGDVIEEMPGEEHFSGEVRLAKKFDEEWIGGTWSYPINPNVSVGVSSFFTTRSQKGRIRNQMQSYSEAKEVSVMVMDYNYSFQHYGLNWKIGVALEYDNIMLGMTITTPKVSLSGDGSLQYDNIFTGINNDPENSVYEVALQDGLTAKYKTPWSIAAGVGFNFWKGTLHLSTEYFSKVDRYTVMKADPFTGQSSGKKLEHELFQDLKSVLNYGIGYEMTFSEKVKAFASYSSDYSSTDGGTGGAIIAPGIERNISTFSSDLNHLGGGIMLTFKGADITLGTTYSFAKQKIQRPLDFPDGDNDPIFGADNMSTIHWSRWRFIVGISIPFFKDVAKKWENKLMGEDSVD